MIIVVYVDGAQEYFSTTLWSFVYDDKLLVIGSVEGDHEVLMSDWVRRFSVIQDPVQIEAFRQANSVD